MSARCDYCGAALRPNARFCLDCGQQVRIVRAGSSGGTRTADPGVRNTTGGTAGGRTDGTASPRVAPPPSLGYVPRPLGDDSPERPAAQRVAAPPAAPIAPAATPAPVPPAAVPPASGAPAASAPAVDSAISATTPPRVTPTAPPPAAPRRVAAPVEWVLRDDDGIAFRVGGDTVLGRRPDAYAQAEGLASIAVDDPLRSVSRVHLRLRPDASAVLSVTDTGSANGTRIERDGGVLELVAGQPAFVRSGEVLWVGERRFRVRAVPSGDTGAATG